MPSTLWALLAKLALGSASRAASPNPVKPVTATTSAMSEKRRGSRPFLLASFYESAGCGTILMYGFGVSQPSG